MKTLSVTLVAILATTAGPANQAVASQTAEIPKPAPLIASGAWAGVLKEHPRLLGPRAHLQALAKAKPDIYKLTRTENTLLAVGVTHAAEGVARERVEPFIHDAMQHVNRGVTDVHQDTWIALASVAQTFNEKQSNLTPLANRWRIEVQLSVARTDDVFLHVLTTDESKATSLVRQADQIGTRVGDIEVLFGTTVGGTVMIARKQFPLEAKIVTGQYE